MTLMEISEGYREAAVFVRFQLNEVTAQLKANEGNATLLEFRRKNLRRILYELNQLQYLTANYYTGRRDPQYTFCGTKRRKRK